MINATDSVRAADISIALYWTLTAGILVNSRSPEHIQLAVQQLVATALVFWFASWCDAHPRRAWLRFTPWPVMLMWTYINTDQVQKALGGVLHDDQLQAWDKAIWGFSPALEWSVRWPYLAFSELLHFCYATYIVNFVLLVLRVVVRHGHDRGRQALGGGVTALLLCYIGNSFYPALGPRHVLPPLDPALQGPMWQLCHYLCKGGAAAAAAFPSGHCALSIAVLLIGWRWDRRLFPVYAVWSLATVCATVYGRFHYSVDSFAGIALGCLAVALVLRGRAR